MKRTNLNIFYHLGESLANLHDLEAGMPMHDAIMELVIPRMWLYQFIEETRDVSLPETKASAQRLYTAIDDLLKETAKTNFKNPLGQPVVQAISQEFANFEKQFDEEHKHLAVFTVLPKGLYDMSALIDTPEKKFPANIRSLMPEQMLRDFKQAALCLAFEIPTACAFHICRGTEALMLKYYELLSKHPWSFKKKDWKIYIEQLAIEGAPKKITTRLDEIRDMDRNSYTHPDTNVTVEEAPVLFELCTGVIFYMAQEVQRLSI